MRQCAIDSSYVHHRPDFSHAQVAHLPVLSKMRYWVDVSNAYFSTGDGGKIKRVVASNTTLG